MPPTDPLSEREGDILTRLKSQVLHTERQRVQGTTGSNCHRQSNAATITNRPRQWTEVLPDWSRRGLDEGSVFLSFDRLSDSNDYVYAYKTGKIPAKVHPAHFADNLRVVLRGVNQYLGFQRSGNVSNSSQCQMVQRWIAHIRTHAYRSAYHWQTPQHCLPLSTILNRPAMSTVPAWLEEIEDVDPEENDSDVEEDSSNIPRPALMELDLGRIANTNCDGITNTKCDGIANETLPDRTRWQVYEAFSVQAMRNECKAKKLQSVGNRAQLLKRLNDKQVFNCRPANFATFSSPRLTASGPERISRHRLSPTYSAPFY
ncbi:uncharacterized protein EV422DRAFT_179608 [Fimicolochytrium jonesii]|uniref:uncharacterized protein n=1 Tax=Fimicolochytrium jonesii TaxID=1396493 RepID=UPI0022FF07F1|nr:uncharacterized protein EV422DRAFT_179608 [Fimicolochytrium jonesii]KAI8818320.1 hypothetical protein EV422DRAFT_179608 [Fimicolochytrium jonesii]